jgi:tetratricopeptide (TPR) repeat protein
MVAAAAQDQPMTSQPGIPAEGIASLRVQVFDTNHAFLSTQALIRLHDPRQMREAWDTTHDRSETNLLRLSPGTWEVEVSAAGYTTSVTHVEVFDQPVQYLVQVTLTADPGRDIYKPPNDNETSPKAIRESQRGLVDLQKRNRKGAEKHLRKALQEAPQNAQINYLLGIILLQAKHISEAEHFLMQAISFDPGHVQALTTMGGLRMQEKDIPGAAKFLGQAIGVDSKQWRPHWLMAYVRLLQNQNEAAKTEAEDAIKLSKDSAPSVRLVLGQALGNLGLYTEAIATLEKFLKQTPDSQDAPAVRKMIAQMQDASQAASTTNVTPELLTTALQELPVSQIVPLLPPVWEPPDVDSFLPPVARDVTCPLDQVLRGASARVMELGNALDSFSATELQVHERLDNFGKPYNRETRKSEYVVDISQARQGQINLQELRRDLSGLGPFSDRIRTRGLLSLAFVFHSAIQKDYRFDCEGLGEWKGQPTWLIHFRQLPEPSSLLQSFDISQDSHTVALKGRAWVGAVDFQIIHIEAQLATPMPEIELMSEHEFGDYGPVASADKKLQLWLPKQTQIYLAFRGHLYRFSTEYSDFKLFSVDSRHSNKVRNTPD